MTQIRASTSIASAYTSQSLVAIWVHTARSSTTPILKTSVWHRRFTILVRSEFPTPCYSSLDGSPLKNAPSWSGTLRLAEYACRRLAVSWATTIFSNSPAILHSAITKNGTGQGTLSAYRVRPFRWQLVSWRSPTFTMRCGQNGRTKTQCPTRKPGKSYWLAAVNTLIRKLPTRFWHAKMSSLRCPRGTLLSPHQT